ncbi:MAG: polysaccharide biosynthesis protein [Deltaproteobacteria bacterium]|nr:polysaccharide biosynthesis protein [Deltaproteobacteria bacterium]
MPNGPNLEKNEHAATGAGRGVLFLTASKLYFMVAGYAVAFGLPRLLDSAGEYGDYGLVNRAVSVLNMVIIGGTVQTVSRFVSLHPAHAQAITKKAFKLQAVIGLVMASAYFGAAPFLAHALGDSSLSGLMQFSSLIVFCYSLYAVFIGSLNGRRLFNRQAMLDAGYSTIKASLILGAAYAGFGVQGAVIGFASASALILLPAYIASGHMKSSGMISNRRILEFQAPMFAYNLALYLLLGLDLFAVKALCDPSVSGELAGLYTAAQYLGQLPYTLVVASTLVLFPLVSRASSIKNRPMAANYITTSLRYAAIVLVPLAVLLSADSTRAVLFFYPGKYADAGPALEILAFGGLLLALSALSCAAISGYGRPGIATGILFFGLLVSGFSNWFLVPLMAMKGAALSTVLGGFAALAAAGTFLKARFGAFISLKTFFRLTLAGVALWFTTRMIDWPGRPALAAKWCVLGILYFLFLWILREVKRDDITNILKNKRGRAPR